MEYVPIAIEMPDHFVTGEPPEVISWFFGSDSWSEVEEFIRACGLTSQQEETLLEPSKWETVPGGFRIRPPETIVWNLTPKARANLYRGLGLFMENPNHYAAFFYDPEHLGEHLAFSGLKAETVELFKRLLYPAGHLVRFADQDLVLRTLSDRQEKVRFVKTVARQNTMLIKLRVNPNSDLEELMRYWGASGRAKDIRPLLESLARVSGGCKIDLAHLLPPFARQRIYTFPNPNGNDTALTQDCHWSSFNFFKEIPENDFFNPQEGGAKIEAEYDHIGINSGGARFGDLIFLQNTQGVMVHSAVFIADDIVFTKNGASAAQPWVFMKLDELLPIYELPNGKLNLLVYRKK